MPNDSPAHRRFADLKRCRPNRLIRLVARVLFRCGLQTKWVVATYLQDVEYRALRNLVGNIELSSSSQRIICVPSSDKLLGLWPEHITPSSKPNLDLLTSAESEALAQLCDDYWNSFLPDFEVRIGEDTPVIRNSDVVVHALNLLGERGPEILPWARARLQHPGYDARQDAAWLLGRLAERKVLGDQEGSVAQELLELATRPWEEDTKETQANRSALDTLAKINAAAAMAAVRRILTSHEWDGDDLRSHATEILSGVANERFMEAANPVEAARAWITANQ